MKNKRLLIISRILKYEWDYFLRKFRLTESIPHSAGYLRQKIILPRRRAKKLQNQILFISELNRRLNPIDKDKMNRLKTLKNPPQSRTGSRFTLLVGKSRIGTFQCLSKLKLS